MQGVSFLCTKQYLQPVLSSHPINLRLLGLLHLAPLSLNSGPLLLHNLIILLINLLNWFVPEHNQHQQVSMAVVYGHYHTMIISHSYPSITFTSYFYQPQLSSTLSPLYHPPIRRTLSSVLSPLHHRHVRRTLTNHSFLPRSPPSITHRYVVLKLALTLSLS